MEWLKHPLMLLILVIGGLIQLRMLWKMPNSKIREIGNFYSKNSFFKIIRNLFRNDSG